MVCNQKYQEYIHQVQKYAHRVISAGIQLGNMKSETVNKKLNGTIIVV